MNEERDQPPSELEWLAFRYVAGELDAAEARALEVRLANDQTAREAVSRAVALSLELASAKPTVGEAAAIAPRADSRRPRRSVWGLAAVAASVALVAAYLAFPGPTGRDPGPQIAAVEPRGSTQNDTLGADAEAWLRVRNLGDSVARLERDIDDWESDELESTGICPGSLPPRWLLDISAAGDGRGKP